MVHIFNEIESFFLLVSLDFVAKINLKRNAFRLDIVAVGRCRPRYVVCMSLNKYAMLLPRPLFKQISNCFALFFSILAMFVLIKMISRKIVLKCAEEQMKLYVLLMMTR